MNIRFVKLHPDAVLPTRATDGSVGYDLTILGEWHLQGRECALVPTGLALAERLPDNIELQIRPRSSLYRNTEMIIPNSPGTIDPDYTGEIKIQLLNLSKLTKVVSGRVAQLVFNFVELPQLSFGGRTSTHERDGFGSTG
jgi:dUTP pyrophosphatase